MILRKRNIQAAIIVIIAAIIALAGTFAWYSFNQRKQNIFELLATPNVNLHDDFAGGPKKDVYVENGGDIPVLVRIRLTELMNVGGELLPEDAIDSDEIANWHIHTPDIDSCDTCAFEAHKYFTWIMGGQKFYMPAHQSARGSHSEDDVYTEPVAVGEKEKIIDYKTLLINAFKDIYANDQEKLDTVLAYISKYSGGDDSNAALLQKEIESIPDGHTVSVKQYEGQPEEEYIRQLNEVRLTLIPSQIISIYDWLDGTTYGEPRKTGDFWVMDADGWCYWAGALEPDQATGLLISSVIYESNYSGEDMIYKINVSLNATTFEAAQLSTFFLMARQNGGITETAMQLMFLASGDYVLGEDGGVYLIEGGGMYRKIQKNPQTGTYVNYTLGEQVYVGPDGQPGGENGGINVGGTYILGEDGSLTGSGDGAAYLIKYITQGVDSVAYLETENGIYLCPVDASGTPDNNGSAFAIMYPGTDGTAGTKDDIGPIRAGDTFPQWYFADIVQVGDGDVIETGEKGTLIRADNAAGVPIQTFGVEQSVYKVQEIVRGEDGLLYLRLTDNLYAAALNMDGNPVMPTKSEDKDGEPLPGVYYTVYPDENGKIGAGGDTADIRY